MIKAFKFRIYPKKNQEVKMIRTLDICRHLYNDSLAERKKRAELNNVERRLGVYPWGKPQWISYEDQANKLVKTKEVKKNNKKNNKLIEKNKNDIIKTSWLKDDNDDFPDDIPDENNVFSQVLQNVLKRLEKSFQNFYSGFGYPRFRSRNRYDSFVYPQSGFKFVKSRYTNKDGYSTDANDKLYISKIGEVRIFLHRKIEGKIKNLIIKRDIDRWFAIFVCEIKNKIIKNKINETNKKVGDKIVGKRTGIDVGLKSLLTLSNGYKIEPPKFFRKSENKLSWEQIKLSRKKNGSNNRNKQRIKVGKVHRLIRNQRLDFSHKLSTKLVKTFDEMVFEDLQIKNMIRNHNLAKSIADAGWSLLIRLSHYKAEWAGKIVRLVNPNKTSQICICGASVPKDLSVRTHKCPECGLVMDRDRMSAILISRLISKVKVEKERPVKAKFEKIVKDIAGKPKVNGCGW